MIGTDVAKASTLLSNGKLVAIPTETVYGLAANALDPKAIAEIYSVKKRPTFNPLILHIGNMEQAKKYVTGIPAEAVILMKRYWPGSLSILLTKSQLVPDIITAGSKDVVLRVPSHPLTLSLLNSIDFPLAAPSANISNTVSSTTAKHVENQMGNSISYIIDGGQCKVGIESTIVKIENHSVIILREGGISREKIEKETGLAVGSDQQTTNSAPGQQKKHYATRKPLYIVNSISDYILKNKDRKCSALLFEKNEVDCLSYHLSDTYDLSEIANSLFSTMILADEDTSDCIVVEKITEDGIGRAIADRLERAATSY